MYPSRSPCIERDPLSPVALRVVPKTPGPSRAHLAGIAGGMRRRSVAGVAVGCSLGLLLGLVPVVGVLPGLGAPDLMGSIWALGPIGATLSLLWSEPKAAAAATESTNKVPSCDLLCVEVAGLRLPLPAGSGGEGGRR